MTLDEYSDTSSSSLDSDLDSRSIVDGDESIAGYSDIDVETLMFDSSKEIYYRNKYNKTFEEVISSDDAYILNLDGQKLGQSIRVVAGLSDFTCKIYDFDNGNKSVGDCLVHDNKIVDVKIGSSNSQLSSIVYTGSEDGTIKLWDLRLKEKCVSSFKDNTDTSPKPLSCFDISCDGRFLAAGTDLLKEDAFILFWDIRSTNLLGGYWDSHRGDITQVKFHPTEEKTVISGSVDGIINLFDVTQATENDALQLCLNTNSSVAKLNWLNNIDGDSVISCITYSEEVQLWHTTDVSAYIYILRETLSKGMNLIPHTLSQLINCHQTDIDGNCMVLVQNNHGNGEHLQSFNVIDDNEIPPRSLFKDNKQIVRCSWYDYNSGVMITGGEAGILNIWSPIDDDDDYILSDEKDVCTPSDKKDDCTNEYTGKCSLKQLPNVSLKKDSFKPY